MNHLGTPAALVWRLRQWFWTEEYSDAPADPSASAGAPAEWDEFWRPAGGIQNATAHGVPRCAKLQSLVRRGIPPEYRAAMWRMCAAPDRRGGYYQGLLEEQQGAATPAVSKQIDKDLHRTFGALGEVRVPQQEALASLRNVLMAYAAHNPEVGYCQSMNFVVAVLLLVVDEETAFWCLAMVVEKLLPGHFCANMAMSLVDQGVLRELLVREDPQLMEHLDELQVVPSLVSTQWLLTCFVGSAMPLSALLRLWDSIFYEGHISFLFRACGALIKQNRGRLLEADNAADAYTALVSLGARLPDAGALLDTAYALPWDALLQPRQLAGLRQSYAQRMVKERAPAADQAAAATAVAAAAVAEAEARGTTPVCCSYDYATTQLPAALAAAPGGGRDSGWTVVPVPQPALSDAAERHEGAEEWNLVERERGGHGGGASSLSYVILQLEAPSLDENYFGGQVDVARRKAEQEPGGLFAKITARLDALISEPPEHAAEKGRIVIAF